MPCIGAIPFCCAFSACIELCAAEAKKLNIKDAIEEPESGKEA